MVDKTVDGVQPVARTATALLYLPPKPSLSTAAVEDLYRFTWSPDVENAAMLPEVIELGRSVDMRSIIHRMFTRDATLKSLDEQMNRMDMLVRAAATRSDRLTLAFAPWPDELLRRPDVYTQASLEILAGDAATWEPYLRPVFQRFGHARCVQGGHVAWIARDDGERVATRTITTMFIQDPPRPAARAARRISVPKSPGSGLKGICLSTSKPCIAWVNAISGRPCGLSLPAPS